MKKSFLLTGVLILVLSLSSLAQTWTQVATYGGFANYSPIGFSIGNKGYAGTGSNTSSLYQDFWEYDPVQDAWTQKSNIPGNGRYLGIGFSIGNFGYAGTGYSFSTPAMSDMYKYDPSLNTWSAIASIPVARVGAVAFVIGQKAYVLTGDHTNNNQNNPSTDVWEYNPANDTWTAKTSLPSSARVSAFGFSVGGKGYIGAGYTGSSNLTDFWEYDPQLDSWTQRTNVPAGTRVSIGFAIGYRGFYATGFNSTNSNQMYEYDPILDTWTSRPNFGGAVRYGPAAFVIGTTGYVGCGRANSNVYGDWWKYTDPLLSISEANVNAAIEVYPNPVSTECVIHIVNNNATAHFTFEVFNLDGKRVCKTGISNDYVFSREGLSSGTYIYKISDKGNVIGTGKLLIL